MFREGEENSIQDQGKIKKTDPEKRYRRVLAASPLVGDQVQNSAGEDLGKVDEIMIDIPAGKAAYAVLSFGGFLGMGNKLFADTGRSKPAGDFEEGEEEADHTARGCRRVGGEHATRKAAVARVEEARRQSRDPRVTRKAVEQADR